LAVTIHDDPAPECESFAVGPVCICAELWLDVVSCAVTDQNARTYSSPPWLIVDGADGDETQLSAIGEAAPEL
jgi:hypothetical protein